MNVLDIVKPKTRNKSHLKALLFADLINRGYDVFIDVTSNSLVQYTKGLKGYAKIKFDIVIYIKDKPLIAIMINPTNRRFTKSKFYGIPIIVLDHRKYTRKEAFEELLKRF